MTYKQPTSSESWVPAIWVIMDWVKINGPSCNPGVEVGMWLFVLNKQEVHSEFSYYKVGGQRHLQMKWAINCASCI